MTGFSNNPEAQDAWVGETPAMQRRLDEHISNTRAQTAEEAELEMLRDVLMGQARGIIDTLLSKREDYGTLNIKITGRYGLAVRMQDKVSRLLNLSRPGAGVPHVAETLEDTYRDLAGYALIGLVPGGWNLD